MVPLGDLLAPRLVQPGDMLDKIIVLTGTITMLDQYNNKPHLTPCIGSTATGYDRLVHIITEMINQYRAAAQA